jgi:hypothetical protein
LTSSRRQFVDCGGATLEHRACRRAATGCMRERGQALGANLTFGADLRLRKKATRRRRGALIRKKRSVRSTWMLA